MGLIGLLSLSIDGWFYFVIFHRPPLWENSLVIGLQKVRVTFKLALFVPILFSYTVAPFSFETNYFSQTLKPKGNVKRSVLCKEEWQILLSTTLLFLNRRHLLYWTYFMSRQVNLLLIFGVE